MPKARANGIEIEYDTCGDSSSPPLLLIMGLGGQMILWDWEFCKALAEQGLYVIRFDNRDVGLSTKLEQPGQPDPWDVVAAAWRGESFQAPYTLEDMADDAFGLMDVLGLPKAHVCGASMGGMIAQTMAIRHPERILSLVSMCSSSGDPELMLDELESFDLSAFSSIRIPRDREGHIEHSVQALRELGGPRYDFDEASARRLMEVCCDRAFCPDGATRQLLAVMVAGSRKPGLRELDIPTLVIHGDCDPLIPLKCGEDTARAVPGAELLVIEGMGHGLLPRDSSRVAQAIGALTRERHR